MVILRILSNRFRIHPSNYVFIPMTIGISSQMSTLAKSVRVSREVDYVPTNKQNFELKIFQYQSCPFCCKTRAYFDIRGLNYSIVEVNSLTKSQLKWNTDYKKVPVVLLKDNINNIYHTINDSSQIISILESKYRNPKLSFEEILSKYTMESKIDEKSGKTIKIFPQKYQIYSPDALDKELNSSNSHEILWRRWIDDKFVHVISPNIYRTFKEALDSFWWFSKFGRWNQEFSLLSRTAMVYIGAMIMTLVSKNLVKQHNLSEDVRSDLYRLVNEWMDEIDNNQGPYNGGKSPNLADISLYGVMTAFEGTDCFKDMLKNTKISHWLDAMQKQLQIQRIFE